MQDLLSELDLKSQNVGAYGKAEISDRQAKLLTSFSPIDGKEIASVQICSAENYEVIVTEAKAAFETWRMVPAPERGQLVREISNELRAKKKALGKLISLEVGKILAEGEGEVQEAIDIADFALGQSRQLYGLSMHSERRSHRMYEQWHPLGVVGIITAFNFPAAVWSWNSMLAAICGDATIWKPSELAPITAVAVAKICRKVAAKFGVPALFSLCVGDGPGLGVKIAEDKRIPLVSATGSCRMGRSVGETVAKRLGRSILELGGNNAIIVAEDADLQTVIPSSLFGAVGTAGQRCTSLRRAYVHEKIIGEFLSKLVGAYKQVKIGNPLESGVLMGPLVDSRAKDNYLRAIQTAKQQGAEVVFGGEPLNGMPSNLYVQPTIIKASKHLPLMDEETFAPILFVVPIKSVEEGIALNNGVSQGLSSAIFTGSIKNSEMFLSAQGSDCGIANVNIGTSGAEIGGAFGGEKDTGGGRESGSDSWKQYMRRQTNTINYGSELALAQGIKFDFAS